MLLVPADYLLAGQREKRQPKIACGGQVSALQKGENNENLVKDAEK